VTTEVLDNFLKLLVDLRIIDRPRANSGKRLASFIDAVLLNEPTGGLVGETETNKEDGTRENLQSKRHAPLAWVGVGHVQRGAVIYEERKADTSDVEQLHAADATTSDLLVGIFSDVSRDDSTRRTAARDRCQLPERMWFG
jgi:hypothetical protein